MKIGKIKDPMQRRLAGHVIQQLAAVEHEVSESGNIITGRTLKGPRFMAEWDGEGYFISYDTDPDFEEIL